MPSRQSDERSRAATPSYPGELEAAAALRDGTAIRLRPIRPEDEPLLHDLAAHMTAEDLRMRFFAPIHGLSHELAARLSQLDYDREMALVALAADAETALGVARYAAGPDKREAEFAIALRSDWKGRGLGYLLLTRLIEVARARGIAELAGIVLRENRAMLQMCRELGFAFGPHADPAVVRVSRVLSSRSA
jgi:acetyltransferase